MVLFLLSGLHIAKAQSKCYAHSYNIDSVSSYTQVPFLIICLFPRWLALFTPFIQSFHESVTVYARPSIGNWLWDMLLATLPWLPFPDTLKTRVLPLTSEPCLYVPVSVADLPAWICNSVAPGLYIPTSVATPALLLAGPHWWQSWLGPAHSRYLCAFPASDFQLLPAAESIPDVPAPRLHFSLRVSIWEKRMCFARSSSHILFWIVCSTVLELQLCARCRCGER